MKVLFWHVHGGYTDGFVRGDHEYLLPVGENGDGGIGDRNWPAAIEVPLEALHETDIDVVVLQRPEEIALVERLTGRVPGHDLPAVFLEHNTPGPDATGTRHPLADRDDIPIVHVTHFNRLFWDNGIARTVVVQHGVPDPGPLYTGELPRVGVVVNEPLRRGRVTGTDLLPWFSRVAPLDVFGMKGDGLPSALGVSPAALAHAGNLSTSELQGLLAKRRVYLHPFRWTSLGLALLEAMHLGMPVVGLATTEVARAVPPEAGLVSNDLDELSAGIRRLIDDPSFAVERGLQARRHALEHYGLDAFLRAWDGVLAEALESRRTLVAPSRRV
ncbi:glycosyltransferase [Microbacterium sp. DT81.1]